MADTDGRMVYTGGVVPELFRCGECPYTLYGDPDELSRQAQEIWSLLCQPLVPEHPESVEFYFRLLNIDVGSPESQEIYRRLMEISRLLHERKALEDEAKAQQTSEDEDE